MNEFPSSFWIESWRQIFVNELQPSQIEFPIFFTEEGTVNSLNDEHSAKEKSSILITEEGIKNVVINLQLENAYLPIVLTEVNDILVNSEHPEKVSSKICDIEEGIFISVIFTSENADISMNVVLEGIFNSVMPEPLNADFPIRATVEGILICFKDLQL